MKFSILGDFGRDDRNGKLDLTRVIKGDSIYYNDIKQERRDPMLFVLQIPKEGMPQPRCPSCREEIHAVHSRLLDGEEVVESPRQNKTRLHKILHTCPSCYSVLGLTDY